MSNPRDAALLLDIVAAAQRILAFTDGMDESNFRSDARTHLAVQHQILVIGEAAKRLSPETREHLSGIRWRAIARMRDRLIHGYDTVDLGVVWDTVEHDIPVLVDTIARHRADET